MGGAKRQADCLQALVQTRNFASARRPGLAGALGRTGPDQARCHFCQYSKATCQVPIWTRTVVSMS